VQLDEVTGPHLQAVEPYEDDSLADFIKSLTLEQAASLWVARLAAHPHLADLL
jgi:hypothetical protein